MEQALPTKFEDLDAKELYRSAIEDFAVPIDDADKNKKKVLLAALVESGVKWADYVAQHPEVAPVEEKKAASNVVTSAEIKGATVDVVSPEPEEVVIKVKEEFAPQSNERYLIKMTRDNPLYSTCGYKFTSEHPYALVKPEHVDYILEKEDGFRQATPSELREFYERRK